MSSTETVRKPTATEQYIARLTKLGPGELGQLRAHAGRELDEDVDGFDLFAGLWWPLRRESPRTPRREVAWLAAKLFAACPLDNARLPGYTRGENGAHFAVLLGRLHRAKPERRERARQQFDQLLATPLSELEPALRQVLRELARAKASLDWAKLVDDLSAWEKNSTRKRWAKEYLGLRDETNSLGSKE